MLDYRIYTFLSLCETLSYTRTAIALKMTQPGVTQHIHLLEKEYGCRLFSYSAKVLSLTEEGRSLERHLRSAVSAEQAQRLRLCAPKASPLRIGVTKTIGDYVIGDAVCALTEDPRYHLTLEVDNTDVLLKKLGQFEIDLALIEGLFDKSMYAHRMLCREPFVGICAREHPFAGRKIRFEELLSEHILLREQGSGTRALFERLLQSHNYTVSSFSRVSCIGSFSLLRLLVKRGNGISYVYRSVAAADPELASFTIQDEPLWGEFNYVYLPSYQERPWFLEALETAISGTRT